MLIEALIIYVSLALATGIKSYFDIFNVVKTKLAANGMKKHIFVESPIFSGIAWIILASVFFPFTIDSILRPNSTNTFITSVYNSAIKNG